MKRRFQRSGRRNRATALVVLAALAAAGLACGEEAPLAPILHGMCYSPFRDGQTPWGPFPTESQVGEELALLYPLVTDIRTYGNNEVLYEIPRLCNEMGINCHACAWLGSDHAGNQQAVSRIISVANAGYPRLKSVIVGNEAVVGGHMNVGQLITYLQQVRSAVSLPVTTAEGWHTYRDYPELAAAVDYIMIHVHPYWGGLPVDTAANDVLTRWNEIRQLYPGKDVVVGETGWPTAGETWGLAVPSEDNQVRFVTDLVTLAQLHGMKVFDFSAFDEAWKADYEGDSGAHWGFFYASRAPKPVVAHVTPRENHLPIIDDRSPDTELVFVEAGTPADLQVAAHDPDGDLLAYAWSLNGEPQAGGGNTWSLDTSEEAIGPHLLAVRVDDARGGETNTSWQILVGEGDEDLVGSWSFNSRDGRDRSGWGNDLSITGRVGFVWNGVTGAGLRFYAAP